MSIVASRDREAARRLDIFRRFLTHISECILPDIGFVLWDGCTVPADLPAFWTSNAVPIGPQGKAISEMSPAKRDELRARLREALPVGKDGRIAYEAFA